jgi:hypothetical protein
MADNKWEKRYKGKNLDMFGNPIHKPTKKYKEGWDRIFGKKKMKKETKHYITHGYEGVEILVPVTESEKLQNELEPIDKETEKFFDDIANNTPNSGQLKDKK